MKSPSPCKTFNKKRSLACYKLMFNIDRLSFDHYELYRIANPKEGEYYVLPIEVLQKQVNRHISYHKSGAFHWRTEDGERIAPQDGEADHRRASLLNQAMSYLSHHLDGYCLAVGKRVDKKSLITMLGIMDGYILPSIDPKNAAKVLLDRKSFMVPLLETPQRVKADKIIKKAIERGKTSTLTHDEMVKKMKDHFGEGCKISNLEPKNDTYLSLPVEVMQSLVDISRELCDDKAMNKPEAFWTNTINACQD